MGEGPRGALSSLLALGSSDENKYESLWMGSLLREVFPFDDSSAVPELRTNLDPLPINSTMVADGIGMRASQEARWKRNVKETRERQRYTYPAAQSAATVC